MTDMIDLAAAAIVNSPDVRAWPVTTQITEVAFDGTNTRLVFSKQDGPDRWPDVTPPGWDGPIQYTVWLFLKIAGQWVGAGFIDMWHGRDGCGDAPSDYANNWYYGTAWSPMQENGPILVGESIGFMVTAGDARHGGSVGGLHERSNVVTVAAPADDRGVFTFPAEVPGALSDGDVPPQVGTGTPPSAESADPSLAAMAVTLRGMLQWMDAKDQSDAAFRLYVETLARKVKAPVYQGVLTGKVLTLRPVTPDITD